MNTATRIHDRLSQVFQPNHLVVRDDSHLHQGHSGYDASGSHFAITIEAEAFCNCSRIQTHRMIYQALSDIMPSIHALAIEARAPTS